MRKNTASQVIGAQMITAADGSAFTGAVAVYVTVDGGTQASGSGTDTHEGNGFHSYAPTQAETNGDHIAFTFTGSGAIPVTIQVYTTYPQTGDSYARLGAPSGANVSADIADIPTVAEFEARTLTAADYFDPAADTVANVTLVGTCTTNADMRGTDSALLASSAPTNFSDLAITSSTGRVTVGTNNDKAGYSISGTKTTLDALNDFDPASDTVANVTEVAQMAGTIQTLDALDTAQDSQHSATQALVTTVDTVADGIKAVTDNLPNSGALSSLATASALSTVSGNVTSVKATTDSLTFTKATELDVNIQSINGVTITGDGQSGTEFGV